MMLGLLIALQAMTKPMGQLVTGSCVNGILAVTALLVGLSGGLTVALISPVLAYLLGIAPQILTVPAIMVGNGVFVILLSLLAGKDECKLFRRIFGWLLSALGKFATLYALVVWLICGVFSQALLSSGMLKEPMLKALPATFSWPQLFTALMGGGVALLILPLLRKAIRK